VLNQPTYLEIANVGVSPADARWIAEFICAATVKQLGDGPRVVTALDSSVIVGEFTVVTKASCVLKKLPQGERL